MDRRVRELEAQLESVKARLQAFEHQSKQLDLVIKATGVGIWDWDVQTGETVFNERWANIIGYTLDELRPVSIQTWLTYAHPDDLNESDRLLKAHWAGDTEYYIFESRMKHKDGHWVWVYDTGQVVEWLAEGVPKRMVGTHLDISDKKQEELRLSQANKQLAELSYEDSLTGIPNRRAFDGKYRELIAAARRANSMLSLLIIDIDFFKRFNDLYGHEKGDQVLRHVASTVSDALPRQTDFAARYGGEELVILLPFTPEAGAVEVANKVIEAVATLKIVHEDSVTAEQLTVSIGVATTNEHFDDLFQRADNALYQAKRAGRNRACVYIESAS